MLRRHRTDNDARLDELPPARPPQETPGIIAAREAQARARQGFLDAVDTGTETRAVTERMHDLLRRNHFGPMISEVFKR